MYAVIDRLNLRGSDACSDTCSQLSDPPSVYGHREVTFMGPTASQTLLSQSECAPLRCAVA